jgi:hypothetical protein
MSVTYPQVKRTVRHVRQVELTLRVGRAPAPDHPPLGWDEFVSTTDADCQSVKYPLSHLLQLEREEFKAILDEYCAQIYAQTAQDHSLSQADVDDPQLLARLGFSPDAGSSEVKRRVRVLAKQYHPDRGGESAQFVELVALYERRKEGLHSVDRRTCWTRRPVLQLHRTRTALRSHSRVQALPGIVLLSLDECDCCAVRLSC